MGTHTYRLRLFIPLTCTYNVIMTFNGAHSSVPTLALQTYPPVPDLRAELKNQIKDKQAEQSALQRGILASADSISEAEENRRRALSAAMDDEIDAMLSQYREVSAAQGIPPTPRPQPSNRRGKSAITRPPGAVKGG